MTLRAIEVAALCQAFVLVLASLAWAFLGPAAAVPILLVGTVTNALEYRKTRRMGFR